MSCEGRGVMTSRGLEVAVEPGAPVRPTVGVASAVGGGATVLVAVLHWVGVRVPVGVGLGVAVGVFVAVATSTVEVPSGVNVGRRMFSHEKLRKAGPDMSFNSMVTGKRPKTMVCVTTSVTAQLSHQLSRMT